VRFDVAAVGDGALVKISVNGVEVAHGNVSMRPRTMAGIGETFDVGRDSNAPVSDDYKNEGVYTGEIEKVLIDVQPPGGAPIKYQSVEPD
jgi:hypothetical protein